MGKPLAVSKAQWKYAREFLSRDEPTPRESKERKPRVRKPTIRKTKCKCPSCHVKTECWALVGRNGRLSSLRRCSICKRVFHNVRKQNNEVHDGLKWKERSMTQKMALIHTQATVSGSMLEQPPQSGHLTAQNWDPVNNCIRE